MPNTIAAAAAVDCCYGDSDCDCDCYDDCGDCDCAGVFARSFGPLCAA